MWQLVREAIEKAFGEPLDEVWAPDQIVAALTGRLAQWTSSVLFWFCRRGRIDAENCAESYWTCATTSTSHRAVRENNG